MVHSLQNVWTHDGRLYARWHPLTKAMHQREYPKLRKSLTAGLCGSCSHIKGHGGLKGAVRKIHQQLPHHHFVARFDVARYYESIHHATLLAWLANAGATTAHQLIVHQYLHLPDRGQSGVGLVAGGSLSPLIGAMYLSPLDAAMETLMGQQGIFYVRYMDDILIMAKTRWSFRRAIALVHRIMEKLQLRLHQTKRFIGKVESGFDFLGYTFCPGRKLRPSAESLRRFQIKFRRLYEQKAKTSELWRYVIRWTQWLWGGLDGLVTSKGGRKHYYYDILKRLKIEGMHLPDGLR